MRQRRLKAPDVAVSDTAYYHCVSRVVNRDFVFGPAEKQAFVRFMRMYERFCGLRVVAYCMMSNHFHLLVGVPKRPAPEVFYKGSVPLLGNGCQFCCAGYLGACASDVSRLLPTPLPPWPTTTVSQGS